MCIKGKTYVFNGGCKPAVGELSYFLEVLAVHFVSFFPRFYFCFSPLPSPFSPLPTPFSPLPSPSLLPSLFSPLFSPRPLFSSFSKEMSSQAVFVFCSLYSPFLKAFFLLFSVLPDISFPRRRCTNKRSRPLRSRASLLFPSRTAMVTSLLFWR